MSIKLFIPVIVFCLSSAVQAAEVCAGKDVPVGTICDGGTIFAGALDGVRYMTTPGNCSDSPNPVCDGRVDTLVKIWGASGVIAGTKNEIDGRPNTQTLVTKFRDTAAARYCDGMNFGGYSDWYLPAEFEMLLLKQGQRAIGSFNSDISWYWTSTETIWPQNTEYEKPTARVVGMGYTGGTNLYKKDAFAVRCVRRF
ncbi:hypothetical protein D3C87_260330 [compost metagenome]